MVRNSRGRMWEKFHKLRSSEVFRAGWVKFLHDSIESEACPIFFQFVTDSIMEGLIKEHFPVEASHSKEHGINTLDYEEVNALRYTAGYVTRALKGKDNNYTQHHNTRMTQAAAELKMMT